MDWGRCSRDKLESVDKIWLRCTQRTLESNGKSNNGQKKEIIGLGFTIALIVVIIKKGRYWQRTLVFIAFR